MDLKSKKLMRRKSKVDQIQQNPDGGKKVIQLIFKYIN